VTDLDPLVDGFGELTLIGRGGSSDVYRAVDEGLGCTVAIKVLRLDGQSADPTSLFLRECEAAERVSVHPHIATVHRWGTTADGRPYVVVQDATNGSLVDELRAGPLTTDRVVEIGRAIAAALAYAHAHGVQHRDVKPSNVLVAADGTPLLADFGLAAVAGSTAVTVSGHPYTLAYAPPELLRGHPADERADVYALGATLYELLEGRPPFAELGLTMAEVLARTLNSTVPPITRADAPRSLRQLVASMLSPDPSDRPVLDDVIAVLADPHADSPSSKGRRRRSHRFGLIAGAAGVVMAVAVALVWWSAGADRAMPSAARAAATRAAATRSAKASTPYRTGTDESAQLASSLSAATAAGAAIVDEPATALPMAVVLPPPTSPAISSFPDTTRWRFSHQTDAPPSCWEYFPSQVTMTGFAATARVRGAESVIIAHYAFENADEAAQIFRGRTAILGVTKATCRVAGTEVHIDQRTGPVRTHPAWADQVSSWTFGPDQRVPQERAAVAYLFRVGRTLWELRIGTGRSATVSSGGVRQLIDAIGSAAER
jgi:serine/threonine-protein kinase